MSTEVARLPRPTFRSALCGELSAMRSRKSVRVSTLVWCGCVAIFAYLVAFLTTSNSAWYPPEQIQQLTRAFMPEASAYYPLVSLPNYGAVQFMILGAIVGSSDFARGIIATIAARFPNRSPLFLARILTLTAVSVIIAVATIATSVACSIVIAFASGRSTFVVPLGDGLVAMGVVWVVATCFTLMGLAVGTLTRSVLASLVVTVVWIVGVETLLIGSLAPLVPALASIQGYLPVGATSSLAATMIPVGQVLIPAPIAHTSGAVAIAVLASWTVLSSVIAWRSFTKRDLA